MHASTALLEQYLLGGLPAITARGIQEHVAGCDDCQQTLSALERQNDTVVLQLRRGKPVNPYEEEPSCHELIARLTNLDVASGSQILDPATCAAVPPRQIRDYRLLNPLGGGGMGTVYRALHTRLNRPVALKLLSPGKLSATAIARFEQEMRVVGQLDHPHIVRATDAGVADGRPYLVMELLEGVDLDGLVREQGPLDVAMACAIIRQAALGLQYAFEQGVVHRDVKPSNLMLARGPGGGWQVKVLDLGLALYEHPHVAPGELTTAGQLMGTIDYMAPEQAEDTHRVDIRADVYGLGATLFRVLSGMTPLADPQRGSLMRKLRALATVAPPDIRTLRPDVPAALAGFIRRLLSKRPEERPGRPIEVAEFLAPFAVGCELAALPADPVTKRPVLSPVRPSHTVSSKRHGRRRRLVAVAGLSCMLMLAVMVFKFTTRDGVMTVQLDSEQPIASIQVDGQRVEWTHAGSSRLHRFQVRPGQVNSIILTTADGAEISADIPVSGLKITAGQSYTITATVPAKVNEPPPARDPRDQVVIEWVRQVGGTIGGGNAAMGYVIVTADDPLPAESLDLVTVDLAHLAVAREACAHLHDLPHLTTFIAPDTPIDDLAIAQLGELPRLSGLYLSGTTLTDTGMAHLKQYSRLEHLHVAQTGVTDASLESLPAWPDLAYLFLSDCAITDRSVELLARQSGLKHLHLNGTQITRQGVLRLHAALPACKIESNYGVFEP